MGTSRRRRRRFHKDGSPKHWWNSWYRPIVSKWAYVRHWLTFKVAGRVAVLALRVMRSGSLWRGGWTTSYAHDGDEYVLRTFSARLLSRPAREREMEGWWSISSESLFSMLERVRCGEDPSMVYAEEYANSEHERPA